MMQPRINWTISSNLTATIISNEWKTRQAFHFNHCHKSMKNILISVELHKKCCWLHSFILVHSLLIVHKWYLFHHNQWQIMCWYTRVYYLKTWSLIADYHKTSILSFLCIEWKSSPLDQFDLLIFTCITWLLEFHTAYSTYYTVYIKFIHVKCIWMNANKIDIHLNANDYCESEWMKCALYLYELKYTQRIEKWMCLAIQHAENQFLINSRYYLLAYNLNTKKKQKRFHLVMF